jgi:uncharacterized protein YxjI
VTDFNEKHYLIRKQIFTVAGAKFHVYDPAGRLVLFSKQKAFKLKEDIRIYHDESMLTEVLVIKARNVIDFSASYDVVDSRENKKIGALRRKGMKSILRDSWEMLDNNDHPVARIEEDSMLMSLLRRFISNLIPQTFHLKKGEKSLVTYKQNFNPFVLKLNVNLQPGSEELINPQMALAAGVLLAAIEGRQG